MEGGQVGARVQEARERRGWSKRQLAQRAGVNDATILRIERGETPNPGTETLRKIAGALGVSYEELSGERTGPPAAQVLGGVVWVPVMRVTAAAGDWSDTAETLPFPDELFEPGRRLGAVKVNGESMAPEIESGDYVVVDANRTQPQAGEIVVGLADGALVVKRHYCDDHGRLLLVGTDGRRLYPSEFRLFGVVLYVWKPARRRPL